MQSIVFQVISKACPLKNICPYATSGCDKPCDVARNVRDQYSLLKASIIVGEDPSPKFKRSYGVRYSDVSRIAQDDCRHILCKV